MIAVNIQDKNVVIVGASSGLGKVLAESLAKEGCNLFLLSRRIKKIKLSFSATKITCDVTNPESVKKAFSLIDRKTDRIDVLVNCAGIGLAKKLEDSKTEEIENAIRINLIGTILVSREAYKRMLKNKSGHIINISSTSGKKARENETVYCASKWGVVGFTESLRLEAKANKIRATVVCPGGMKTNFYKDLPKKDLTGFMDPKYIAEEIVNLIKSHSSICPSEFVIEMS